ncbi:MAG: prolipoprotein diacylglyceryl transferase [Oscillospiraceae bacterium]
MALLLQSAAAVTTELEVEFPNLFDGLAISYYRGFRVFGISIYWYGVIITLGVILAYLYAHLRTKEFGIDKERMFDVVFASIIGGFFGARLYYCVFTGGYTIKTFFTTIRDGGLAIYGGIIGALLVGVVMCKIRKVHIRAMFDIAALGFLIGQCIGRWGNFVNQEAYGGVADPNWLFGMSGDIIRRNPDIPTGALVHPCFLYESLWCLLGFILLHIYSKKLRSYDGELFLLYVSWYGLGRFFIEGLRADSLMIGEIKVSQLLAAVTCVAAIVLFVVFKVITKKKNIPLYVNSEAWEKQREEFRLEAEKAEAKKAAKKNAAAESILAEDADEADDSTAEDSTDETGEEAPETEETNEPAAEAADSDSSDESEEK